MGEPLTSLASLWSGKCPLQCYRTNIGGGSTPSCPPPPARRRYPVLLCSRSPCFDWGQRSHDEEHMVSFHVHGGLIGPTIFMAVKTIDQKSYKLTMYRVSKKHSLSIIHVRPVSNNQKLKYFQISSVI